MFNVVVSVSIKSESFRKICTSFTFYIYKLLYENNIQNLVMTFLV